MRYSKTKKIRCHGCGAYLKVSVFSCLGKVEDFTRALRTLNSIVQCLLFRASFQGVIFHFINPKAKSIYNDPKVSKQCHKPSFPKGKSLQYCIPQLRPPTILNFSPELLLNVDHPKVQQEYEANDIPFFERLLVVQILHFLHQTCPETIIVYILELLDFQTFWNYVLEIRLKFKIETHDPAGCS